MTATIVGGVAGGWMSYAGRAALERELLTAAAVVAHDVSTDARAKDRRAAATALNGLTGLPAIATARLELPDGTVVAALGEDTSADGAPPDVSGGLLGPVRVRYLVTRGPERAAVATVVLTSSAEAARRPLVVGGSVLAGAYVLALTAGVLLLGRARAAVLDPLVQVSYGIRRILTVGDFRSRADVPRARELADLTTAVNDLLDRVGPMDAAPPGPEGQAAPVADRDRRGEALAAARAEAERLRQSVKDLILQKAAAEEANLAKSTFLFNMSHELRTPLNAIMGYSEILKEDAVDQGAAQTVADLDKVLAAGRHLLTLITDVLDLSKVEAGRMELTVDTFDVAALIVDVASTSEPLAAVQHNALFCEPLEELGSMRSDPTKIRQILLNLLGNACKFTSNGMVTLRASRKRELADWIVISVEDTGIGMTEAEQARLFREFSQGHFSRQRQGTGSGLGLAISQGLCYLLGGSISCRSEAGVGSVFTVRLPADLPPTAGQSLPGRPVVQSVRVATSAPSGPAVLVIDPDPGTRALIGRAAARAGYALIEAATAEEGLQLAVDHEPPAIVLEAVLPSQNGWRLLERFHRTDLLRHIPVLVVSTSDDRARSLSLGAVDHFEKPVPTDRLFAALKGLAAPERRESEVLATARAG